MRFNRVPVGQEHAIASSVRRECEIGNLARIRADGRRFVQCGECCLGLGARLEILHAAVFFVVARGNRPLAALGDVDVDRLPFGQADADLQHARLPDNGATV